MQRLLRAKWTEGQALAFDLTVQQGYIDYVSFEMKKHNDADTITAAATRLMVME